MSKMHKNIGRVICLFAVILVIAGCVSGDGDGISAGHLPYHGEGDNHVEHRLGVGDVVSLSVFGEESLSGRFRVDGTNNIVLPLLGRVHVGGLTLFQAQNVVRERLMEGYLKDPQVSISVHSFRPVYVIGEVSTPGSYEYNQGLTVLNFVALSGGFTYRADKDDVVVKRDLDGHRKIYKAALDSLVLPGDIIEVKERLF